MRIADCGLAKVQSAIRNPQSAIVRIATAVPAPRAGRSARQNLRHRRGCIRSSWGLLKPVTQRGVADTQREEGNYDHDQSEVGAQDSEIHQVLPFSNAMDDPA